MTNGLLAATLLCGVATACTSAPAASTNDSASTPATATTPTTTAPSTGALTTPVPPPHPGNISQTVHSGSVVSHAPVPLRRSASFAPGNTLRVLSATVFHATAHRPGEISGPAVRLVVALTNTSSRTISVSGLAATCADSHGRPLVAMQSAPAKPFAGSLAAGASSRATYVFELARGQHNPLTFTFGNAATRSVVGFYGRAS